MIKTAFRLLSLLLLSVLVFTPNAFSQSSSAPDAWSDWKFLLGEFSAGESSGVPGQASRGGFTLVPDLGGRILVRKNHAEYAAANGRPAFSHDDLMVIYRENEATKAFYSDNEGHIIHYAVNVSPDKKRIVFLSEGASGPRYRLTYEDLQAGAVKVMFEIAPPDKPGEFARYVEATVRRKS